MSGYMVSFFCVLLVSCLTLTAPAGAALPALTPMPQEMAWTQAVGARLDATRLTGVDLPPTCAAAQAALDRLCERLGLPLSIADDGNLRLIIGTLPDTLPTRTRHEAYHLIVDARGATLTAETVHGIHNGLVTLAMLVDAEKRIPCVTITDWPDQEMRGTYVPGIGQAEERFDQFVDLKLNLLLLEDGGLYDLDNPDTGPRFLELAEKCRDHFIEFVPELQSLGWGHFVLEREPRAVEARWVERIAFPVVNGRVHSPDPPLPGAVNITNSSFTSGMDDWRAETHRRHWNPSNPSEAAVVPMDNTDSTHALQVALSETGSVRVSQELTVQPNARYSLRSRIKTQAVEGNGAYIEVYGVDPNGAVTMIGPNQGAFRGDSDWQETQVIFDTSAEQRARPGGALVDTPQARDGFERVRIFLRLQDGTGTAWFDEVEVVPMQSPNPLANIVVTDTARVVVESTEGLLYEEGRDYRLEAPELQYPYNQSTPLHVILTENSAIKNGDKLLLSFNQARMENITCCPSEPLYDAFMRKSIHNVVEKLRPKYLHIGHDEPRYFNRDQRCRDRQLSNEELFIDAIRRIRNSALEADPEIRIMLWDDALNPYQNGPSLGTSDAARGLPRDLIINLWWYDNFDMKRQLDDSTAFFMKLGFSVTGSPWFRAPNAYRWAELFNSLKDDAQALGIIYTSWGEVPEPWGALELTAEHSWSFGKPSFTGE